eukprot:scaffold1940_cov312-Prasinococcus_capsulatus_cf.AAC.7
MVVILLGMAFVGSHPKGARDHLSSPPPPSRAHTSCDRIAPGPPPRARACAAAASEVRWPAGGRGARRDARASERLAERQHRTPRGGPARRPRAALKRAARRAAGASARAGARIIIELRAGRERGPDVIARGRREGVQQRGRRQPQACRPSPRRRARARSLPASTTRGAQAVVADWTPAEAPSPSPAAPSAVAAARRPRPRRRASASRARARPGPRRRATDQNNESPAPDVVGPPPSWTRPAAPTTNVSPAGHGLGRCALDAASDLTPRVRVPQRPRAAAGGRWCGS